MQLRVKARQPAASFFMNCMSFLHMLDIMQDAKIIHEGTRIYATHINHKHSFIHEELQEWYDTHSRLPVTVAWDGLEIKRG